MNTNLGKDHIPNHQHLWVDLTKSEDTSEQTSSAEKVPPPEISEFVVYDPPLSRFGLQLRLRRRSQGYDPLEFAAKIKIEIEELAAIEFGYAPLEEVEANLKRIAVGLGIPPAALRKFLDDLRRQ